MSRPVSKKMQTALQKVADGATPYAAAKEQSVSLSGLLRLLRRPAEVRCESCGQPLPTKIGDLKAAAAAGDWESAIRIAAKFPRLGSYRSAILDGHLALTNPRFLSEIGKNPNDCIEAAKKALILAYRLEY